MKFRIVIWLAFVGSIVVVAGCNTATPTPTAEPVPLPTPIPLGPTPVPPLATPVPPTPTAVPPTMLLPLSTNALKNAEYQTELTTSGKAKLTDGTYKEQAAPGSATPTVIRLSDTMVFADLDGDGVPDAVVILITELGGGSTFYHLAAVLNQNGVPQHVASLLLGDRVQIKSMTFEASEIVVNLIAPGARDLVSRRYRFQNNKLVFVVAEVPTQVAAVTPTQPAAAPKPKASATPTKPAAPQGFIAYHFNDKGIDRVASLSLETKTIYPLFDVGPVMDIAENTNAPMLAWSPDSSKIAFIATRAFGESNSLKVYDARSNTTTGLFSSDAGGGLSSPTWSPDSKQIAFIRLTGNKLGWVVNIVNADGTPCTEGSQWCTVKSNSGNEQFRGGLSWSKQGVFALGMNTTGKNDIYTLNRDGSGLRNLTNHPEDDSTPTWSPDGKRIAFTSCRDGRPQIYVMNVDGTGLRRVSQSKDIDFSPTWSPDGNWLAFASTRGGQTDIYMMDLSGSNLTRLTHVGADHPTWTH